MSYGKGLTTGLLCGLIASIALALVMSMFTPTASFFEGFGFLFGTIAFILVPVSMIIAVIIVFVGRRDIQG